MVCFSPLLLSIFNCYDDTCKTEMLVSVKINNWKKECGCTHALQ